MLRRQFFRASAGTGLVLGLPESTQINAARRIDREVLTSCASARHDYGDLTMS